MPDLDATTLELTFPTDLDHPDVARFLAVLAHLPRTPEPIAFDLLAEDGQLRHAVTVAEPYAPALRAGLRSALPGVRVRPAHLELPLLPYAVHIAVSSGERPLADQPPTPSAVLSALASSDLVGPAAVQWLVRSRSQSSPPSLTQLVVDDLLGRPRQPDAETKRERKAKLGASPVLSVVGRVGATSRGDLGRIIAALRTAGTWRVHVSTRVLRPARLARDLAARQWPRLRAPQVLNADELASLLGWPIDVPPLPGLHRGNARTLPAPRSVRGVQVATSTYDDQTSIRLADRDRLSHLHVLGPTGVGKSTLLADLILQDIAAGSGVVVLDPKGDLVSEVLARIPEPREDVIVLDPADAERPVGWNLLDGDQQDVVVDQVVGVFHDLFRSSWGPRTADVLRASLLTLTANSTRKATIVDVAPLLESPRFRRELLAGGWPPELDGFWRWFDALSAAEHGQVVAPVLNKLRTITLRPGLRRVLGQPDGIDVDRVLTDGQVLLVPLQRGRLGPEATRLFGSLLTSQLWQAIAARSGVHPSRRRPVFVYLDEVQDLLHGTTDLADALAQSRGLAVGLTLAHQSMSQLPSSLHAAVLANTRSKVLFRLGDADARVLAREVGPDLEVRDLRGLPAYEVALQLNVGGERAITTGRTRPLPPPIPGRELALRRASAARWGTPASDIDDRLRAAYGMNQQRQPAGTRGPPGRERR